jgi:hypothetical protein
MLTSFHAHFRRSRQGERVQILQPGKERDGLGLGYTIHIRMHYTNLDKRRQANPSQANPSQAKPSQAKPSQDKTRQDQNKDKVRRSQAEISQYKPSQAKLRRNKTNKNQHTSQIKRP